MPEESNQQPRGCLDIIGGTLSVGLALILGFILIGMALYALGAILIVADPLEPSDAIVALSGGEERIQEAARLYQDEYSRTLILTETGEFLPEWNVKYSTLIKSEAVRLGIPNTAILITEGEATSTYEEAERVKDLMYSRSLKTCIVVTDPFHSLRTRLIFRNVFSGSELSARIRPVQGHWYTSRSWWLHPAGWEATIKEYVKLLAYLIGFKGM